MKRLTTNEEIELLNRLKSGEFEQIGNGAARIVFANSANGAVIKLGIGVGGVRQNNTEIDAYLNFENAPLAKIIAHGRFIEIMESVEIDEGLVSDAREYEGFGDFDDFCDYVKAYEDEDRNLLREYYDTACSLEEINGVTGDNGQLGRNRDGRLVAYDYGFTRDYSCGEQTSGLTDELAFYFEKLQRYIGGLIDMLVRDEDTLNQLEDYLYQEESGESGESYGAETLELEGDSKDCSTTDVSSDTYESGSTPNIGLGGCSGDRATSSFTL